MNIDWFHIVLWTHFTVATFLKKKKLRAGEVNTVKKLSVCVSPEVNNVINSVTL